MKIFENKSVFKKLIIVLLCILLLSFCIPKGVSAKDDGIGGKLLSPVIDLLIGLGDGALNIIHSVIYGQNDTLLTVDMTNSILVFLATIAIFIVIAVVVAAAVVWASGALVAALAVHGITLSAVGVGTVLIVSTTTGIVGAAVFNSNVLPDNLQLPVYSVSPEEIFSNEIGLFDVDFFNPNDEIVEGSNQYENLVTLGSSDWNGFDTLLINNGISKKSRELSFVQSDSSLGYIKETATFTENGTTYKVERETVTDLTGASTSPAITYILYKTEIIETPETAEYKSIAYQLRSVISNWYTILRDISLVALLSILVYTGIRIVISSTSNDKAKYKQMLMDWVVAICLLFVMQYIMSFSNLLVEKITDIFKTAKYDEGYVAVIEDENGKIEKALTDGGYDVSSLKMNEDGKDYIQWKTNLLGVARLNAQMAKDSSTSYAGYALIFIILVLFTLYFIFTYLKRVLYMAFLTLIAPLVALTYPIDKMTDGKAQAFNSWFKEYIFNLLIQPMHLLLYTILVSSAFELASTNIIYSLVALAFMIPAEKLLRRFFGFEKAHTPGLLAGPAGAAATMGIVNKLLGKPPKGVRSQSSSGKEKSNSSNEDNSGIKYKDILDTDLLLFGNNPNSNKNNANSNKDNSKPISNDEGKNNFDEMNEKLEDSNHKYGSLYSNDELDSMNDYYGLNDSTNVNNTGNENDTDEIKNLDNEIKTQEIDANKENSNNADNEEDKTNNKRSISFIRAGKAGIKYYGNGMKKKIENKLNNSHPLRAVPKVIGGVAGGLAAGTLGLAAGITSGDVNKTVQYTAGSALGGYKFGGAVGRSASGLLSVEGTEDVVKEAYYGEKEYKERQIEDNIKRVQSDDKLKRELSQRLGNQEEAELALKEIAPTSVRYGLEKANEIAAVYERSKAGEDTKTAVAQVKYVSEYGKNTAKLGHKDSEDLNNTIMDRVRKNSKPGTSEEEMKENARRLREKFDATSKVVYKKL